MALVRESKGHLALGVTQGAASQWLQRAREGSEVEALRTKNTTGVYPG